MYHKYNYSANRDLIGLMMMQLKPGSCLHLLPLNFFLFSFFFFPSLSPTHPHFHPSISDSHAMWDMLYNLGMMIAIPWLIRTVLAYVRSTKNSHSTATSSSKRFRLPKAEWHHPTSLLLLSLLFYYGLQALVVRSPPNFFREIQVEYNAPSFKIRNAFRDYANARSLRDPTFDHVVEGLVPPRSFVKSSGGGDSTKNEDEFVSPRGWMSALFELLKVQENRHVYLTFGEDAYTQCNWCREQYDFLIYNSFPSLMPYVWFTLFVFLATMTNTRRHWRIWSYSFACCLALLEYTLYVLPREYVAELLPTSYWFLHGELKQLRYLGFSLWMLLVFTWQRNEPSLMQRMERVMQSEEAILSQMKALQVQQMAMMDNEDLARQFVHFNQQRSLERERIFQDPELEQVRRRVLANATVVGMTEAARTASEDLMQNWSASATNTITKR